MLIGFGLNRIAIPCPIRRFSRFKICLSGRSRTDLQLVIEAARASSAMTYFRRTAENPWPFALGTASKSFLDQLSTAMLKPGAGTDTSAFDLPFVDGR